MVDLVDIAGSIEAETIAIAVSRATVPIPAGAAGECDQCEWWMPRLVDGLCAFCRDGRPRPPDWDPPTRPDEPAPILAPQENTAMSGKSIMLPASAPSVIAAVVRKSDREGISLGQAAVALIERGLAAATTPTAIADAAPLSLDDLLDQVRQRFADQEQASVDAAIADASARAAAAEARLAKVTAALA